MRHPIWRMESLYFASISIYDGNTPPSKRLLGRSIVLKLKRVDIQGFKSFYDRSDLRFHGTGIGMEIRRVSTNRMAGFLETLAGQP